MMYIFAAIPAMALVMWCFSPFWDLSFVWNSTVFLLALLLFDALLWSCSFRGCCVAGAVLLSAVLRLFGRVAVLTVLGLV